MSSVEIIELTEENTCKLCKNGLGIYTCPRCNVLYCSVECYKSKIHSLCSEQFYKECVMQEFDTSVNQNSKKKMYDILSRLHGVEYNDEEDITFEGNDSDDEDFESLAERMANVDINNADLIWDKLTNDEKQEFEALIHSSKINEIIPDWKPWWQYRKPKKLIEQMGMKSDDISFKAQCPRINQDVLDFQEISKTEPSACVKYNLINVLTAYTFTARYFMGDHHDFKNEAIRILIALSSNLRLNNNFYDIETSVQAVKLDAINSEFIQSGEENLNLMKDDIMCILRGPEDNNIDFYTNAALSDIYKLFSTARKRKYVDANRSEFSKRFIDSSTAISVSSSELKILVKKIEYYLSYVKTFGLRV